MKENQITASMAKDIAFKLGAELNNEEAEIFADGYNAAMQSFGNSEQLNSPAIPDDWVMVPKEPTQAMINAWLSEVADWRGHVAGYKAALAAAPQQEVKSALEIGMARYAGAMQRLAEGDK